MNSLKKNYPELYKLQDKVFAILRNNFGPFYLTGGTALCRHYLDHRYSEDIDLFINEREDFTELVQKIRFLLAAVPREYI